MAELCTNVTFPHDKATVAVGYTGTTWVFRGDHNFLKEVPRRDRYIIRALLQDILDSLYEVEG